MINLVKIISTEFDNARRRIIKFLRFGKADVQTSPQAAPFGSDANPPSNMRAVYVETGNKGDAVIIGFINTDQLAEVGENRLYSTDKDGNLIFEMRLRNDGTIEIGGSVDNLARFSKLKESFDELKADLNSHITDYNSHIHITTATVSAGPPGTIVPTPSTSIPSIADIDPAKIEELKSS